MSDTTARQTLWTSPSYRKLSAKRRQLATRIILEGNTFSQACKALSLNQTRERANFDLQLCLAEHAPAGPLPEDPGLQHFDTPRDEVMAAWYAMADFLESKGSWDGWAGGKGICDEAIAAAEMVNVENGGTGPKPCPKATTLDPHRVAEFLIECRRGVDEIFARLHKIKSRRAELAGRALCDGCQGAVTEPRAIAGIHVYCAPCAAIWRKSGTLPQTAKA
jgi:hypothetical protein